MTSRRNGGDCSAQEEEVQGDSEQALGLSASEGDEEGNVPPCFSPWMVLAWLYNLAPLAWGTLSLSVCKQHCMLVG